MSELLSGAHQEILKIGLANHKPIRPDTAETSQSPRMQVRQFVRLVASEIGRGSSDAENRTVRVRVDATIAGAVVQRVCTS